MRFNRYPTESQIQRLFQDEGQSLIQNEFQGQIGCRLFPGHPLMFYHYHRRQEVAENKVLKLHYFLGH